MIVSFRNYESYRYARQSRIILILPWYICDHKYSTLIL